MLKGGEIFKFDIIYLAKSLIDELAQAGDDEFADSVVAAVARGDVQALETLKAEVVRNDNA